MATNTLSENINQAISDFRTIKQAIIDKGVQVPTGTPTSQYGAKIGEITSGGTTPTNGFLPTAFNESGYPTEGTLYGLTTIPDYYFYNLDNTVMITHLKYLENVNFKNNIIRIGNCAFQNCPNLTLTGLPNSVVTIGDNAFAKCPNLALTELPDSITSIGDYAFRYCTNLPLKKLPNGITSIGKYAFTDCANLLLTELPDSITSIATSTFQGCTNLALTNLPNSITNIGGNAFAKCPNLALTELPESVTTIGSGAFANCTNLPLKKLPSGITSIENSTFFDCKNVSITEIPAAVNNIGGNAFFLSNLTTLTFLGTPTTINANAFGGCSKLTTINVPWAEGAVANAPWGATNATINYGYTQ